MKIKFFIGIILLLMLAIYSMGAVQPEIYFEMKDPVGDDFGYGTYHYPSNIAFQPYQGLFDITMFRVLPGKNDNIYFDISFLKVTNPWAAPEGFIHQNIRIFIDTKPNQGLTVLPYRGANIKFNPKYAWEVCLRIIGWGNSQFLVLEKDYLKARVLDVKLLEDGQTIRASIPRKYTGNPLNNWRYYVLVGSYDGFGDDFFRKIAVKPGDWVIGGGIGNNLEPRIMDMLASKSGPYNQVKQLRSFDLNTGKIAMITPVGRGIGRISPWIWFAGIMILLLIIAIVYSVIKKSGHLTWFWVQPKEKDAPKCSKTI